jgi:POT family proton-dependent oligopeptide transporter
MWILGQTEMWERFSFYGMKALLVPYLILTFGLDQAAAKEILGTYVLLVYLAPLFAGIIADRFLNLRQSIYIGALVMALGHFAMAFVPLTYVGMALIIAGNGFFKPCATNMVGQLYGQDHPWRSSAYSLFYFSINVGAFISPLICGWLQSHYGYHWGFAAAGFGMMFGLLTFRFREDSLGQAGLTVGSEEPPAGVTRITSGQWRAVWIFTAVTVVVVSVMALGKKGLAIFWTPVWLLGEDPSATTLFFVRMALVGILLFIYTKLVPKTEETRSLTSDERQQIWVIGAISFAMFLLVIALEQAGGTLNLFAQHNTQETIFGVKIPFVFYQSVNPFWVLIFTWFTAWLWPKVEKRGVTDLHKLGPGLLLVSVAFFLLWGAFEITESGAKASPLWLIGIYGFIAASEVCISVIGLSAVNKLAPKHLQAFFTAVFFMSIACGGYLAGTVDAILKELGVNPWITLGLVSVGLAFVYMASANKLLKYSHGRIH